MSTVPLRKTAKFLHTKVLKYSFSFQRFLRAPNSSCILAYQGTRKRYLRTSMVHICTEPFFCPTGCFFGHLCPSDGVNGSSSQPFPNNSNPSTQPVHSRHSHNNRWIIKYYKAVRPKVCICILHTRAKTFSSTLKYRFRQLVSL